MGEEVREVKEKEVARHLNRVAKYSPMFSIFSR